VFGRRRKTDVEPLRAADPLRVVLAYHEASKHDFGRYAAGPFDLDWATQPDPFRTYEGAERIALERLEPREHDGPLYEPAFCAGEVAPAALDARSVSQLFFDSLAISAWKRYGDSRWSLRCNPSSGNLHPTEGWLVCGPIADLCRIGIVAHYAPREHELEVRAPLEPELARELLAGLPPGCVYVALTSIHWREAWKYGERAFRYSQHDAGHAIAALAVAAAGLGWRARVVDEPSTAELARLLGVDSQRGPEAEHADVLLAIGPEPEVARAFAPTAAAFARVAPLVHAGRPNELSPSHVEWGSIDLVEGATVKPRTAPPAPATVSPAPPWVPERDPIRLRRIVRGRRSAVEFDGRSAMTRDAFLQTLRRTLPRGEATVLAAWGGDPQVDLLLFVHRVEAVDPGLLLLLRDPRREPRWRAAARADGLAWKRVEDAPDELALFRLRTGDARSLARAASCNQDIAADGCFAVSMVADFRATLERGGPWEYRRLFWECGFVGQLLYLEAEALGLRGTGIGCFFDDAVHRALALGGDEFQALYHFTTGGPVDDPRITTEPAYVRADAT
jgi:SagB-type dehydrogenase family enzyme